MKNHKTVTIALNGQISTSFRTNDFDIPALIMLASFTGTTITFQGAVGNSDTFKDIYDTAGALVSVTVSTDRCISLANILNSLKGFGFIKIKSGSAEVAERTIVVVG